MCDDDADENDPDYNPHFSEAEEDALDMAIQEVIEDKMNKDLSIEEDDADTEKLLPNSDDPSKRNYKTEYGDDDVEREHDDALTKMEGKLSIYYIKKQTNVEESM